ncbi:MAG TPA: MATE family efflux transporter [Candidatus Lachnoclostridium stercoripullorum]|uniref:Probable multidrug resistance protein NorM n=1 Tax=Candidatus Lachnoclostridium stercoripullorum TaxID=2838635 RepID=A0A9D1W5V5_9FIRM|nr:MATE family efflux transporter [Candidatus Lachnoclostridium stercoripullorum]
MKTATADRSNYLFSNRALVTLIIPLIIEQFLNVLVGMADTIMVSNVGEAAVSGVSLVDSVMLLLINVFQALATGGAVVAGQYLGRQREKRACEAANQLVWFVTLLAVGIMAIMYLGKGFILHVVFGQIDADVMHHANIYLLIVNASIPFIALYNAGAAIFRSMGNSQVSMKVSMLMNIINVCGNAILVYGFGCGAEGVAIPTLISRMVAAILITVLLLNQKQLLHIKPSLRYQFRPGLVKKILQIGIPNGLENSMFQLGKIIVLSLVSTFGTYAITANAVANTVASFQTIPGMAMNLAITTVISQCVGARDYEQARYYTRKLLKIAYASVVVTVVIMLAASNLITQAYNLSDITAAEAIKIFFLHGISVMMIWPTAFSLPSTLRAAGDVRFCMITSVTSMWVCRVVFSYVFGQFFGFGVFGVWMAMILDWWVRAFFFVRRYRGSQWMTKALV